MSRLQIGVIGSAGWEEYPNKKPSEEIYKISYEIGRLIAQKQAILVCGGKGGVMLEACKGAKENGGIVVGVVSGNKRGTSNEYVDIEVISGFVNKGEESLLVSMCDGFIAIGGGAGTLQEITNAYRNKKPIIVINGTGGWSDKLANTSLDERKTIKIYSASSTKEALRKLFKKMQNL